MTPTYPRREQTAELTRLAQTLLHIKDLHWVLAEDAKQCSNLIPSLMKRYPTLPFTYLASPIPEMYTRLPKKEIPRGVSSRRAALSLISDWHNKTACANREAGKPGFFLTSAAEKLQLKDKTQAKNSASRSHLAQICKNSRKTHLLAKFPGVPLYAIFITKYFQKREHFGIF